MVDWCSKTLNSAELGTGGAEWLEVILPRASCPVAFCGAAQPRRSPAADLRRWPPLALHAVCLAASFVLVATPYSANRSARQQNLNGALCGRRPLRLTVSLRVGTRRRPFCMPAAWRRTARCELEQWEPTAKYNTNSNTNSNKTEHNSRAQHGILWRHLNCFAISLTPLDILRSKSRGERRQHSWFIFFLSLKLIDWLPNLHTQWQFKV